VTCVLDIADDGARSQAVVARLLGISTVRVQQLEARGLGRLRTGARRRRFELEPA
jgi:DNA-directed RNA polymerase specialized sigma subunit